MISTKLVSTKKSQTIQNKKLRTIKPKVDIQTLNGLITNSDPLGMIN